MDSDRRSDHTGYRGLINLSENAGAQEWQMSEALESVITSATLRAAIGAKIDEGVSPRAISLLINAYAPSNTEEGRDDDTGARRLPIEVIAYERRAAFLIALDQLQDEDPSLPNAASA
jgi:hypothetical protein